MFLAEKEISKEIIEEIIQVILLFCSFIIIWCPWEVLICKLSSYNSYVPCRKADKQSTEVAKSASVIAVF